MKYFLSLGSNLGERAKNLLQALAFLEKEGIKILKSSSFYETQPVDVTCQPWFFNQVVEVETDLDPLSLFHLIKKIEKKMGRKRRRPKGPRIIDIDILLAEGTVVQTKELKIPHPRMVKRNFVLIPLKEISADTLHPVLRENIENIWKKAKDGGIVRRITIQSCKDFILGLKGRMESK